jgi:hypothetical protein
VESCKDGLCKEEQSSDSSSDNSKSPFRGLECLRPRKRGERFVAVATS